MVCGGEWWCVVAEKYSLKVVGVGHALSEKRERERGVSKNSKLDRKRGLLKHVSTIRLPYLSSL